MKNISNLRQCFDSADNLYYTPTSRLALMEEAKSLPFAAVWDYHCLKQGAPVGEQWLAAVKKYEIQVLSRRS